MVHSYRHLFEAEDEVEWDLPELTDAEYFIDSCPPERWLFRHYLIYIHIDNPTLSVRSIADMLNQGEFPFKVQKTKVGDELRDMSIQSRPPIHVPRMTEQQCSYRELFAPKIFTDFRILLPWMFTDEVMISRNNDNYLVRMIPTLQPPDEFYVRTEQYPIRIMVWAAIARDFKSPIMRVNGHLNTQGYQQMVWESGLIQHMNERYGTNAWIFQQDGGSPHQANTTKQFLAAHCQTLSSDLHWPAHSPDLNVIENLWGILKRRMAGHDARTPDELWLQIQRVWNEVTVDEINNLVESFRPRLMSVIALHGESLNGHNGVRRMLGDGCTPAEISALHEEEKMIVRRFIELSREFSGRPGWNTIACHAVHQESIFIVQQLPRETREKLKMMRDEEKTQSINGN
jgi:hypothetical protein